MGPGTRTTAHTSSVATRSVATLVVIALAFSSTACSSDETAAPKTSIGPVASVSTVAIGDDTALTASSANATVQIPRDAVSDPAATVEVATAAPLQDATAAFGDAVAAIGDGVQVRLSGATLSGAATVRFRLPADFDSTRYVPGIVWESPEGVPELLETSWAPGDTEVVGVTTHFSIGWPIKIDVGKIANGIADFVRNLVTGRAGAANPTCGDEAAARSAGVQVISDSGDLVKWCVGVQDGRTVVKVTNNWRAGTQVSFPTKWNVVSYQGAGFDLQAIGDWLDSASRETATRRSRLVGPGQTIVLDPVMLAPGTTAQVVAESSTVSWLWSIALTAVDMYLLTVGKLAQLSSDQKAESLLTGAAFIKCYTDYFGEDIGNALEPVEGSSTFDTILSATRFGLDCGKDIIQQAVSGRGGVLGKIGKAVVGVLAAAVGIVYGLINGLFSGIRALIDEIGELFDASEVGGYGYDILLTTSVAAPPPVTASVPGEQIQLYLNMLSYGPLDEDGQLGPASTAALQRFQADSGLAASGQPDQATIDALINRAGDRTYLVEPCGYETSPRPDRMYLSCSLSSGLVDVQWQTWNATNAKGTGQLFTRDCDAGCVNGEPTYVPVIVEASNPERWLCGDGAPFQLFTFTVTGVDGTPWGEYPPTDYGC